MSTTIEDRVILLLRYEAGDTTPLQNGVIEKLKSTLSSNTEKKHRGSYGFWKQLSENTKINSKRWQKVYAREQRITSDMLEALSRLFPEYAFWLATGITDASNGHVAPHTAQIFPERMYKASFTANAYFRESLRLMKLLYIEGKVNLEDDKERMLAVERTRPFAHYWDSTLHDSAYKIAASDEYRQIRELWNAKETEQKQTAEYIKNPATRPSVINKINDKNTDLEESRFLLVDHRIMHQDMYDLFYETQNTEKTKFALSLMNIPPSKLSDSDLSDISKMSFLNIEAYLEHHRINRRLVFPFKGGTIRMGNDGITDDEIERFKSIVLDMRKKQSDD